MLGYEAVTNNPRNFFYYDAVTNKLNTLGRVHLEGIFLISITLECLEDVFMSVISNFIAP